MKKYCAATSEEIFSDSSFYSSYEEAAVAYADDCSLEDDDSVYVGLKEDWFPSVNVDHILDKFGEDACYRFEDGLCGDWPNLTLQAKLDLRNEINETIKKWFTETNNLPNFYAVENVKSIMVGDARKMLAENLVQKGTDNDASGI